ncbi:RNase H family protein [Neptuniibacter sp. QD37_11]|uniref:RNase H family protein n=1 Tax=Neptuniibacter sp. QD37_11 TaxID=3398209 RepID=UPI0039F4A809
MKTALRNSFEKARTNYPDSKPAIEELEAQVERHTRTPKFHVFIEGISWREHRDYGVWAYSIFNANADILTTLPRLSIHGSVQRTTRNRIDLMAAINAIEALPSGVEVRIYTDSEYLYKNFIRSRKKWVENNWKTQSGSEVANKDLWLQLMAAMFKLSRFRWELTDRHSLRAAFRYQHWLLEKPET